MALLLNANDSVSRSYSITKPSPLHPIYPSECGERTENLFNMDESAQDDGYTANKIMVAGGVIDTNAFFISEYIPVIPGQSYIYFTDLCRSGQGVIKFYNITNGEVTYLDQTPQKNIPSSVSYSASECVSFTVPTGTSLAVTHMRINVDKKSTMFFIVEGSTAPTSYIPYGYKLPLLSGSTPVDIYLGESQTTRQIKKLVLTGEENWERQSNQHTTCINLYTAVSAQPNGRIISNIVTYNSNAGINNDSIVNVGRINANGFNLLIDMALSDFATVTAWKEYLAQQYSNGTPVTFWYPLKTPTTGTLNEPLRKIGDYVDAIDSTQTSAQIPTTANSTTISWAGQGLAPSQFDSIQEWVNIPTYKRVNGEWVADN